MTTLALKDNPAMGTTSDAVREILITLAQLGGTGGAGVLIWKGFQWLMKRQEPITAGVDAATAASMSTVEAISRLERHLDRAEKRAEEATLRADKAERERNDALNEISQLKYSISRLTEQVEESRRETASAREEVQTMRMELEKYATKH